MTSADWCGQLQLEIMGLQKQTLKSKCTDIHNTLRASKKISSRRPLGYVKYITKKLKIKIFTKKTNKPPVATMACLNRVKNIREEHKDIMVTTEVAVNLI